MNRTRSIHETLHHLSELAPTHVAADDRAEFLGTGASSLRLAILAGVLLTMALGLGARSVALQLIGGKMFRAVAERNRSRVHIVVPVRGRIVDRHGMLLARGERRYAIGLAPTDLPHGTAREATIADLAAVLAVPPNDLAQVFAAYPATLTEPITLREDLTFTDAIRMYVALRGVVGVQFLVREQRDYRVDSRGDPDGASHLLGYVARVRGDQYAALTSFRYRPADSIGTTGVEAAYEPVLRGMPGVATSAIDARGRVVATVATEGARAGATIALTIDRRIESEAARALRAAFAASGARRGAAVALDPDTGALLALADLPGFPNTALSRGLSHAEYAALDTDLNHPMFPRAIAGMYPSGSTVKPFIAAVALSEGAITPDTRVLSTGGIRVGNAFFPDWKVGGHGWVRVREALAQSVNTFFYVVGGGWPESEFQISNFKSQIRPLGPDGLERALHAFGFGAPTGIDLTGEATGLVPTPAWKLEHRHEPWYIGDTYHLAIGQGDLLVTPLQLARATAGIANGGTLVTPHVLLGTMGPDGVIVPAPPFPSAPIHGVTSAALDGVAAGMRAAVTEGSARTLGAFPFPVWGKTGTAQTTSAHPPHAWFIGFSEVPDTSSTAPCRAARGTCRRVVVTVLVEEGGEGSSTAIPVARAMLDAWANAHAAPVVSHTTG